MKQVITFILFINIISISAQFSPSNRSRGENKKKIRIQKFNSRNFVGIFYYDKEEVLKKVKIKKLDKEGVVIKALKTYNKHIENLAFLENDQFNKTDKKVEETVIIAKQNKNFEAIKEMRQNIKKALKPIRQEIKREEKKLNDKMVAVLSDKQLKKWLKYQKKIKAKLNPKKEEHRNANQRKMKGGKRGGGMRRSF